MAGFLKNLLKKEDKMSLVEKIEADYKAAFLNHEQTVVGALRLLRAELVNKEKEKGIKNTDETEVQILKSLIKRYQDSIETYKSAGRDDLVGKELGELEVVQKYLPAQLNEEDVTVIIKDILDNLGDGVRGDFGRAMGSVMKDERLKGKTDGAVVNRIVKQLLG